MTTQTQFEQLKASGYNLIPVYRQRLADTDTPLSVFARLKDHKQAYLYRVSMFVDHYQKRCQFHNEKR